MIKPNDPIKLKKLKKRRGFYFHNAVHKPLAKKYGISEQLLDKIRYFAIHKNFNQAEICIYINKGFQEGWFKGLRLWERKRREQVLTYLLRCSPEVFADLTRKTKMDWD